MDARHRRSRNRSRPNRSKDSLALVPYGSFHGERKSRQENKSDEKIPQDEFKTGIVPRVLHLPLFVSLLGVSCYCALWALEYVKTRLSDGTVCSISTDISSVFYCSIIHKLNMLWITQFSLYLESIDSAISRGNFIAICSNIWAAICCVWGALWVVFRALAASYRVFQRCISSI